MDSFRFRPTLTSLESRDTPSVSPAEVYGAIEHMQLSTQLLRQFQDNLTAARTADEIQAVADFMVALANQSASGARILGDYSAALAAQPNTVTSHAGAIASAQWQSLINTQTAHLNGLAFGAQESSFFLVTSPIVPPPPPPPPNPSVTVPLPPPVTTTGSAGMTSTFPSPTDPNFVDLGDGVKIWDVVTGQGAPVQAGANVTVYYTLWLADTGQEVQTNRNGSPFTSPLTGLIVGWQEGIPGMQLGGIRRLFIPAAKGYGAGGSPPDIPGNADLVFEVKLVTA